MNKKIVDEEGNTVAVVLYKITDDVLKEIKLEARKATGEDKYRLYEKYRVFLANKGRYLVKTDRSSE
jgi:hypothetical protein